VNGPLNILLIARHFGEVGSGGARRPMLLAQSLRALGHFVTIVSPFVGAAEDEIRVELELDRQGPHDSNVYSPRHVELRAERPESGLLALPRRILPARLMKMARAVRYFPDIEIIWARQVIKRLQSESRHFDWVITTSPPESLHRVGRPIADHFGARWMADLRDSWIDDNHRDNVQGLRRMIEFWVSRRWLGRADLLCAVDRFIQDELRRIVGDNIPIVQIGHFSEKSETPPAILPSDTYNLVHSGAFELSHTMRSIGEVVKSLSAIQLERNPDHLPLHLHIAGRLSEAEIAVCDSSNLMITRHGPVGLTRSRALQSGADGLFLYCPLGSRALPGKIAEYALSGRPIFYMGPESILELMVDPSLARPLNRLVSASKSDVGPIDSSYQARNAAAQLIKAMHEVQD